MLKKLIVVAFIIFVANQAYCQEMQEMTPLQKRVRAIFSEIRNRDKIETVKETEEVKEEPAALEVTEEPTTYVSQPEESRTEIIMASEQEQDETEEYEEGEGEEEIVVATAPKSDVENNVVEEKREYSDVITAADASSKDRTAKIDNRWSVEVFGWNSELDGHVKIAKDKNNPVTDAEGKIDLGSETSIDKKKVPGFKLSYRKGGRASFEFNWVKVEQDGHLALMNGQTKIFNGKEYGGNANFKINNAMYDLLWKYRFSHKVEETGREKSYVAGLLGIKASKMEFSLNGNLIENGVETANIVNESKSETIPVPYIGVEAGTYLGDNLYLKGYLRYLKLNNIKDYDAEHADYDVSLSYKLSNKDGNQDIFFDVGYRQVVYDVEGDGNDVELKYKGPYVGLEFRF
ncbi:MAG: hypothetical protein IKO19_13235 [Candidatus Riflebacteria bacterium]|nr:hypothetical protein [Candidatus Riflebacteria bacterium]MBR4571615.1 hypothetical protein [Candidatus Riflebacteria bacterium]